MAKVPKKNISSEITDIRTPKSSSKGNWQWAASRDSYSKERESADRRLPLGRIISVFFISVMGLLLLAVLGTYASKRYLNDHLQTRLDKVHGLIGKDAPRLSVQKQSFSSSVEDLWNMLKNAGKVYGLFTDVSKHLLISASTLERLQSEWPEVLKPTGSDAYLSDLKELQSELAAFISAGGSMQKDDGLRSVLPMDPASFFSLQFDVSRTKKFIDALIPWLSSSSDRHVLVLFSNTSELRPAGGFIGSYGDAVFKSGHLVDFTVHDINEPDRTFERNLVPPKQLQGVVRRWRAADSNWFFDFSESAHKTVEFLEASKMYSSTTFDGVVAVTPQVVADILKATGPVRLKSGLEINSDNMLGELQRQVQDGQASGSANPKAVLTEIAPELLNRLQNMTKETKQTLISEIYLWGLKKDVMVYFKNEDFENFFEGLGVSGKVAMGSGEYEGYLAVVSANVGGAKTDTFIRQSTAVDLVFGEDGRIMNKVSVDRLHTATSGVPWWYRQTNKSYLMLFAPEGAELSGVDGAKAKEVQPRQNYTGFVADDALRGLELTLHKNDLYPAVDIFEEAGKQVFATWMDVNPSQEKTTEIRYFTKLPSAPKPGMSYRFVIDKQAGSNGGFTVRFTAPQGLNFVETHSPIFEYTTDNPDSRTVITANFEKA